MIVRLLSLLLVGWALSAPAQARPDSVFLIGDKERPQRVVVTIGDKLEKPGTPTSPMVGELDGIVADISGAELGQFLATPMPHTKLMDARGNLERIGVAHLIGKTGEKRVELLWGNEGEFLAQEMDREKGGRSPRVAKLDPGRFRAVMLGWARYRGAIEGKGSSESAAPPVLGREFELQKPYVQGPFFMNQETLGERFLHGSKSQAPPAKRVLSEETMYVRLPRGYDAKHPAGLLVWISPESEGHVPQVFEGALDELGIIGVGIQNIGNHRVVSERLQLALDAAWTVSRRYHVDPRRVYVTGMSGGGRMASWLALCFADIFTGAVPIVGLDTYFNIPVGNGRYLPAAYRRPETKLWALARRSRIAAITGEQDFNEPGVREGAKQMLADGLQIKVYDYPNFAHQMPSAAQFRDALTWVDEPYREMREKEEAAAQEALGKYVAKWGKRAPADEKQRAELIKVTEAGAWTKAAWEAVELLRSHEADAK